MKETETTKKTPAANQEKTTKTTAKKEKSVAPAKTAKAEKTTKTKSAEKEPKPVKEPKAPKKSASEKALEKAKKKAEKEPKSLPAKKLPKLFKKRYLPAKFKKQIEKKLFIEHDKKFVLSFFKHDLVNKKGQQVSGIPLDQQIPKADFTRLKNLAKQINSQKPAVKFIPLLATISAIVLVCLVLMLFRNIIIKNLLVNSMQNIFKAKTDIAYVNLDLFASNNDLAAHGIDAKSLGNTKTALLQIRGLQQANKDSENVMKNLFEIDEITFALNFTELLRGKFVAQKIAVNGVAIGTDRTYSGFIPGLTDKKDDKNTFLAEKRDELLNVAEEELKKILEAYNPQTLLTEVQDELQSPKTALDITSEVKAKVEKWQAKPAEIEKKINDVTASVNAVIKTNWGGINDLTKVKNALTTLKNCEKEIKSANDLITATTKDMETDTKLIKTYTTKLQTSITADKALVTKKVAEMKQKLSPAGFKKIMSNAIEGMLYNLLGSYFPYISDLMDFAQDVGLDIPKPSLNLASNSKSDKKEEQPQQKAEEVPAQSSSSSSSSHGHKRRPGRTVTYSRNKYPAFLIQDIQASGKQFHDESKELFHGYAYDISNNQKLWDKPTTSHIYFSVLDHDNNADIIIDARDNPNPLLTINYKGDKYPLSADAKVFKMSTKSDIQANFRADTQGSWEIGGSLGMNVSKMTGMDFEPAQVCKIYKNALSKVSRLDIGYTLSYSKANKLQLQVNKLDTLASQLATPVLTSLQEEITSIANQATQKVVALISEKTNSATDFIKKYEDISKSVNNQKNQLNKVEKSRQDKIKELEKKMAASLIPGLGSKKIF